MPRTVRVQAAAQARAAARLSHSGAAPRLRLRGGAETVRARLFGNGASLRDDASRRRSGSPPRRARRARAPRAAARGRPRAPRAGSPARAAARGACRVRCPGISSSTEVRPVRVRSVALELDGEAVRLVAHALEQQQAARVGGQHHRVLAVREEEALRLEAARALHARRGALVVALLGDAGVVHLEAAVREGGAHHAELALAAVDEQQVGQRLGLDLGEAAAHHLAQAVVVVAARGLADAVAAVVGLPRPAVLEHHAARRPRASPAASRRRSTRCGAGGARGRAAPAARRAPRRRSRAPRGAAPARAPRCCSRGPRARARARAAARARAPRAPRARGAAPRGRPRRRAGTGVRAPRAAGRASPLP